MLDGIVARLQKCDCVANAQVYQIFLWRDAHLLTEGAAEIGYAVSDLGGEGVDRKRGIGDIFVYNVDRVLNSELE